MSHAVEQAIHKAQVAQRVWADQIPRHRLKAIGKIASQIVELASQLLESIQRPNASEAEKLASEILPLADACRYTAHIGRQILAPRSESWMCGAWWMGRIAVTTTREPWGIVLIIAPSNYPLFLPGVQVVQALAAGNAVLVKPAPNGERTIEVFKNAVIAAGIPGDLLQILPSSIEAGQRAMECGVDKVFVTGSARTGRAVLRQLADKLTPSTMELSGCDAVFVLPQADVQRAAQAIAYALGLNGGATCIAPRRIFVTNSNAEQLRRALVAELAAGDQKEYEVDGAASALARAVVERALKQGARILVGECPEAAGSGQMQPIVLDHVTPEMEVVRSDIFAPIASLIIVNDLPDALAADRLCPYSLGASVFGPEVFAEHWAQRIEAGCVVLNDIIVPTADPRVSFGGRDQSGWGVTRGPDGLLEMTRGKTICKRKGNWLPHLNRQNADDVELLTQLLGLFHSGSLRGRFRAIRAIVQRIRSKSNKPEKSDSE